MGEVTDEACALTREAFTASGDIYPRDGELLVRLDPLTAPRRTQVLAAIGHLTYPAPTHSQAYIAQAPQMMRRTDPDLSIS